MKTWRPKFISLLIIGAFLGFSVYYIKLYVIPKPHGIILFIVPGLNLDLLSQLDNQLRDDSYLLIEEASNVYFVNNRRLRSSDSNPATLISWVATGKIPLPNQVGLNKDGKPLDNLFYKAQRRGRAIGFVTNGEVIAPELAAFYAHTSDATDKSKRAQDLLDNTTINVILGGGAETFINMANANQRNLLQESVLNGYRFVTDKQELYDVPSWRTRNLFGLFDSKSLPYSSLCSQNSDIPSLEDMTIKSIQCLQFNLQGYFLVVHQSLIKQALEEGKIEKAISELHELEKTIQQAKAYAGKNTKIILYSPQETTELLITGFRKKVKVLSHQKQTPSFSSKNPKPKVRSTYSTRVTYERDSDPYNYAFGFGWVALFDQDQSSNFGEGFISPDKIHTYIEENF